MGESKRSVDDVRLAAFDGLIGANLTPVAVQDNGGVPAATPSSLQALQAAVEAGFPWCDSLAGATQCVFGEGSATADVVFVGEAPGAEEDREGRPFVGPAGQKLDEIITAMGLDRGSVYICNVLKARPPGNRDPLPDEVAMAAPWLACQLRLIAPKVIVALGGAAAKHLLETTTGITRLRGRMGQWQDPDSDLVVPVMPTFHPAYLLRNYTPETRRAMWEDMQQVIALLEKQ